MAKILIIDDEKETVSLLTVVLEKEGHSVAVAFGGEEALGLLRRQVPHLILLDITMPGMDGYTFMTYLQADDAFRDLPVMVLTGRENMRDTFQMFHSVVDYVVKPFDVKDLRGRVNAALSRNASGPL